MGQEFSCYNPRSSSDHNKFNNYIQNNKKGQSITCTSSNLTEKLPRCNETMYCKHRCCMKYPPILTFHNKPLSLPFPNENT